MRAAHYFSWRPAWAGDAEGMFGKSRTRLAPGLDKGFLMDVGPPRAGHFGLRAHVDKTDERNAQVAAMPVPKICADRMPLA
jgi:hypothetical protein